MTQELNISGLWVGKQTAKGTENTTPSKRLVHVGGGRMRVARDDGSENWSDMSKYGSQTDWINTLLGNGAPPIEATPSELAYLLWLIHGAETVVAGTNEVQTITTTGVPTGGSFDLAYTYYDPLTGTVKDSTSANIVFNETAASMDTKLEAISQLGVGSLTTGGGPLPTGVTVTFSGATVSAKPHRAFKIIANNLTGGATPQPVVTRTTPGVKRKHTFIPSLTAGFWCTWFQRLGLSVITRESYIDSLITAFTLEASTANKAGRITPTVLCLDPAKIAAADPAAALPTELRPFLYTDGTGTYTIDGVAFTEQSQYTLTVNEDKNPTYGDDAVPFDMVTGQPSVTIGATLKMSAAALAEYYRLVYGTSTPATNAKPARYITGLGSYSYNLNQKDPDGFQNGNRHVLTMPGVKWAVPDAPDANPDGGDSEIALAGAMRTITGQNPYTLDVYNDDVAYTV